jgi:hypothetical protein
MPPKTVGDYAFGCDQSVCRIRNGTRQSLLPNVC